MYLTEDEFKVLLGIRDCLTRSQMRDKYGIQMYTNDPRVFSLAKKYGVFNCTGSIKSNILKKADFSKIEVVSKEEMPYFKYINWELADYIDICKREVDLLMEYFKNVSQKDAEKNYRLYKTECGLGSSLYIRDSETNKISRLRTFADGVEFLD